MPSSERPREGRFPLVGQRLFDRPLAVTERRLRSVMWALRERLDLDLGAFAPLDDEADPGPQGREAGYRVVRGVGVVPVHGTLVHRTGAMDALSGLVSTERLRASLEAAADDPSAGALLLDIDSPGGEVDGIFDLADRIAALARRMPVTALVHDQGCSAAYLLGAAARRLLVTQTATTGSIGVIMAHVDETGLDSELGLKVTEIFRGPQKADGSPHHALDDAERARLQAYVDAHYDRLVDAVARHRGLAREAIVATESGVFVGSQAVEARLADGVATFDSAVDRLAARPARAGARTSRSGTAQPRRRNAMGKKQIRAGEQLARVLNDAIDREAGEDGERSEVIERMGDAAGISSSTVEQIVSGDINCPPLQRLEGFAEVLDVSMETLRGAAEDDGCEYNEDGNPTAERAKLVYDDRTLAGVRAGKSGKGGTPCAGPGADTGLASAADIVRACNEAGLPSLAARILDEELTGDAARKRLAGAMEVRDVCAAFGRQDLADTFVGRGLAADDVRAILEPLQHAGDAGVDSHVPAPVPGADSGAPRIDARSIYRKRAEAARGSA